MRTARDWFAVLKEPYKSKIYQNCSEAQLDREFQSWMSAFCRVFGNWPEGDAYWLTVYHNWEKHIEITKPKDNRGFGNYCPRFKNWSNENNSRMV